MRKIYRTLDIYFPNSDLYWINELERLELNGEIDMQSICRNALADEYERLTGNKVSRPPNIKNGAKSIPISPGN